MWTDSSSALQAGKRIGPGTKLRHLDVSEFYIQGAVLAKLLSLGKIKGTYNPSNFLTKRAKSGTEVRAALPSLGMLEATPEQVEKQFHRIDVKVSNVKDRCTWEPGKPAELRTAGETPLLSGNSVPGQAGSAAGFKIRTVLLSASAVTAAGQGWPRPETSDGLFGWGIFILMLIGISQVTSWIVAGTLWMRTRLQVRQPDPEPSEIESSRSTPMAPPPRTVVSQREMEELELWGVRFSVPHGERFHPDRNCPTLRRSDAREVDMRRVRQICPAASKQ